jgi:adhesin HecA-like repeat protein
MALVTSVFGNIITVTNTNDSGPGSLRQALADANDGDTINFTVTGTIGLTGGELLVDKSITISGPGAANLAVDGNAKSRLFHIGSGNTVSISGLTVKNGLGGGMANDHSALRVSNCTVSGNFLGGYGGGVSNDGSAGSATLTIVNSTVSGNYAYYAGGGIHNDADNGGSATLTIMDCSIINNIAGYSDGPDSGGEGGGIYNGGGTVTITNCSVSNNAAGANDEFPAGYGGGIYSYGTLTITNSTIDNNVCWLSGGGIANGGTLTITSSTISNNAAIGEHDGEPWGAGGGIDGGTVTFSNSTLSGNYANLSDGGITLEGGVITDSTISGNNGSVSFGGGGALEIGNTILNASTGSANIINNGGTITSRGYNLSSDDGGGYLIGPGDQINADPTLGPLQDNGGSTLTHALLPGSPAINAGDPNFTPPPLYDQRGAPFVRVFDGRLDTGSFELQPTPTLTPTPTPRPPRASPTPRSRPAPPSRPTPR